MKQHRYNQSHGLDGGGQPSRNCPSRVTLGALNMISSQEMNVLCHTLQKGLTPSDLAAKLSKLRDDSPKEYYLKQQSELLLSLLKSQASAEFCRIHPDECQLLLRALAYVRKDDDAVPDTLPGGFDDDHDVMRAVCVELKSSLDRFKAWHLTRRVPLLWNRATRPLEIGVGMGAWAS